MKTIKQLAQEVIDCQDAVNLSGVIHSFSRVMTELREIARAEGWEDTDKLNRHPIAVLYSSKIASLTDSEAPNNFSQSFCWVKDLIRSPFETIIIEMNDSSTIIG